MEYALDEIERVDKAADDAGNGSGGLGTPRGPANKPALSIMSAPLDDPKIRQLAQNFTSSVGLLSRASTSRAERDRERRFADLRNASASRRVNKPASAPAVLNDTFCSDSSRSSIDLMPEVEDDDKAYDGAGEGTGNIASNDNIGDVDGADVAGLKDRGGRRPPPPTAVSAMLSIALIGDQGVGKSALAQRYSVGTGASVFNNGRHFPTSGVALSVAERVVRAPSTSSEPDELVQFHIRDTSGAVRDCLLADMYTRDARAILLVADLTKAETVAAILQRYEAKMHSWSDALVVLVGNKADMKWTEHANKAMESFAVLHRLPFCRVSCRTGKGVKKLFSSVASQLLWGTGPFSTSMAEAAEASPMMYTLPSSSKLDDSGLGSPAKLDDRPPSTAAAAAAATAGMNACAYRGRPEEASLPAPTMKPVFEGNVDDEESNWMVPEW